MSNTKELLQELNDLREKLHRAQRQVSGLRQKGKLLETQYEDSRSREKNTNDLIMELVERQRELNVMLNRANIMLNRTQETMALASVEFNEMAKALPDPKKREWADRVARINELFKRSGVEDADVVTPQLTAPQSAESLSTDELRKESEQTFNKHASMWGTRSSRQPPHVEAEPVEDEPQDNGPRTDHEPELVGVAVEISSDGEPEAVEQEVTSDAPVFPPRRKSWWRRTVE